MLNINKVRHNRATANGVDIHYRSAGSPDAPALVLLHGVPSCSHMYRHVISPLAEVAHVIAPDMPGFGFSAAPGQATRAAALTSSRKKFCCPGFTETAVTDIS